MKSLSLTFLMALVGVNALAQNSFVSKNSHTGAWIDNNTWVGGSAPETQDVLGNFQVNGYVRREGDIAFLSDVQFAIRDTLFVSGNVDLQDNTTIRVTPQGVLVITGDFSGGKSTTLVNAGKIVVKGEIKFGSNSTIINGNAAYIYDNSPKFGAGSSLNGNNVLNEQALAQKDPSLYQFVEGEGILPIELLFLKATNATNHVVLNWATAMEENFDYFVIERAQDLDYFSALDSVAGNGNSLLRHDYQYIDYSSLNGQLYYRLKSVDIDGTYTYSSIASTSFSPSLATKIYPNPCDGSALTIHSDNKNGNVLKVKIINTSGVPVFATNISSGPQIVHFAKGLAVGFYIVEITDDNETTRKRLLVN